MIGIQSGGTIIPHSVWSRMRDLIDLEPKELYSVRIQMGSGKARELGPEIIRSRHFLRREYAGNDLRSLIDASVASYVGSIDKDGLSFAPDPMLPVRIKHLLELSLLQPEELHPSPNSH